MELSIECAFHTCFIFSHTVHSTHELEELGITKHISLDLGPALLLLSHKLWTSFFFSGVRSVLGSRSTDTKERIPVPLSLRKSLHIPDPHFA